MNKNKNRVILDDDGALLCTSIVNRRMNKFDVRTLWREEKLATTMFCAETVDVLLNIGNGHGDKPELEGSDPR